MNSSRSRSPDSPKLSGRSIEKELQILKDNIIKERKKFEEFQRHYKIPCQSAYYGSSVRTLFDRDQDPKGEFKLNSHEIDTPSWGFQHKSDHEYSIQEDTLRNIDESIECRICLVPTGDSNMISIKTKVMDRMNVLQAIEEVVSLQNSENTCLPKYICEKCFKRLKSMVAFRRLIISSYENFQKRLNMTHLEIKTGDSSERLIVIVDGKNIDEEDSKPIHSNNLQDIQNDKADEIELEHEIRKNFNTQKDISNSAICRTMPRIIDKKFIAHVKMRNTQYYFCSFCPKKFLTKRWLIYHTRIHTGEKPFHCLVCHEKFSRKRLLIIHSRVHTGEKPFHCDICNKGFSHAASFSVHKRRIHKKVIQGTCSYCGKQFVDKSELDVHIRKRHTGEKPYLCEFCSSAFVCNRSLMRHIHGMHTEKKPCHKCGKMFDDFALKQHLHRHQVQEKRDNILKNNTE